MPLGFRPGLTYAPREVVVQNSGNQQQLPEKKSNLWRNLTVVLLILVLIFLGIGLGILEKVTTTHWLLTGAICASIIFAGYLKTKSKDLDIYKVIRKIVDSEWQSTGQTITITPQNLEVEEFPIRSGMYLAFDHISQILYIITSDYLIRGRRKLTIEQYKESILKHSLTSDFVKDQYKLDQDRKLLEDLS